jgi:toxin ParE1/3/4
MVKWTRHALNQLRHIHDYIAQDSPLYAKLATEAIVNKTLHLDQLPFQGKKVAELNDDDVREFSLYSYRILYEHKPSHIDILAVIHKRRDLHATDIPRET